MADFAQAFFQGRQLGQGQRLNRLASESYTAAPDQQQALLSDIARIDAGAAQNVQQQFQQQEDRTGAQLRGFVNYVNNARKTGNAAAVNAALQQGAGLIQRITGKPAPTEWTPDMDAGWAQLEARVAMQAPDANVPAGLREFNTLTQGLSAEDQLAARRVRLGLDGRASSSGYSQVKFTGADGRERIGVINGRTGQIDLPDGTSFNPQTGQMSESQTQQVSRFTSPDGLQVAIGNDVDPAMRDAIMQYERQFGAVPDGTQAQLPDRQVTQFSGGNQLRTTQAVVPGPSAFVGQSPAERAAAEAAARAQVEMAYAPALRGIQTQGAIEQARGEAQVQTEATLQREEAKRQAERVQSLPQLREQRRVLDDALKGLGTKYRTGPINTVIPDALQSADNQVFMTVVNNAVLDAASKLTGVISDKDMEFLRRATVNLDTREGANREILRRQLRIIDEGIQRAESGSGIQSSGSAAPAGRTVTRRGTINGRRVVQYSDGSVEYGD